MKFFVERALTLGLAVGAACSVDQAVYEGDGSPRGPGSSAGNGGDGPSGSVGFQYSLPGGKSFASLSYTLTNGARIYTGPVAVGSSSTVAFTVDGVAASTGYSLTLSMTSTDGAVTCDGAMGTTNPSNPIGGVVGRTFTVFDRSTTNVNVQLICLARGNAGTVPINGGNNCCAAARTIGVFPLQPSGGR